MTTYTTQFGTLAILNSLNSASLDLGSIFIAPWVNALPGDEHVSLQFVGGAGEE